MAGEAPRGTGVWVKIPSIPLVIPAEAEAVVDAVARDTLELAMTLLAGRVAEEAPKNFGHLAASFQAPTATASGGREVLGQRVFSTLTGRVFSTLPQATVMEDGRRPGFPISRTGVANIGLWVRRKLGLHGREARAATYAIAWSIRKKGLAPRKYAERAFKATQPQIVQMFTEMMAGLADGLAGKGRRVPRRK